MDTTAWSTVDGRVGTSARNRLSPVFSRVCEPLIPLSCLGRSACMKSIFPILAYVTGFTRSFFNLPTCSEFEDSEDMIYQELETSTASHCIFYLQSTSKFCTTIMFARSVLTYGLR